MTKKEQERFSDLLNTIEGIPLYLDMCKDRYKVVARHLSPSEKAAVTGNLSSIERMVRSATVIVKEMLSESLERNKEERRRVEREERKNQLTACINAFLYTLSTIEQKKGEALQSLKEIEKEEIEEMMRPQKKKAKRGRGCLQ